VQAHKPLSKALQDVILDGKSTQPVRLLLDKESVVKLTLFNIEEGTVPDKWFPERSKSVILLRLP